MLLILPNITFLSPYNFSSLVTKYTITFPTVFYQTDSLLLIYEFIKLANKFTQSHFTVSSTTGGDPLQVPCFNPTDQSQISEDEKYNVEILKATKADSELIWNTAAQVKYH